MRKTVWIVTGDSREEEGADLVIATADKAKASRAIWKYIRRHNKDNPFGDPGDYALEAIIEHKIPDGDGFALFNVMPRRMGNPAQHLRAQDRLLECQ